MSVETRKNIDLLTKVKLKVDTVINFGNGPMCKILIDSSKLGMRLMRLAQAANKKPILLTKRTRQKRKTAFWPFDGLSRFKRSTHTRINTNTYEFHANSDAMTLNHAKHTKHRLYYS